MKQLAYLVLISIVLFSYSDGHARNTHLKVSISEALELGEREGGNAVVNIRSKYGKNEFSSTTDFECGAGAVIAGVTLVGDVVKIAN